MSVLDLYHPAFLPMVGENLSYWRPDNTILRHRQPQESSYPWRLAFCRRQTSNFQDILIWTKSSNQSTGLPDWSIQENAQRHAGRRDSVISPRMMLAEIAKTQENWLEMSKKAK